MCCVCVLCPACSACLCVLCVLQESLAELVVKGADEVTALIEEGAKVMLGCWAAGLL